MSSASCGGRVVARAGRRSDSRRIPPRDRRDEVDPPLGRVLGAPLICGPLCAPWGVFSGAPRKEEEKARAVAYLREVAPYAEERGVTIVLEYLNRFEMYLTNTAADLAALVRDVDHPRVRMMYDTFHAHIEEKDPRAALRDCADVLVHVHASENAARLRVRGRWPGTRRSPASRRSATTAGS